MKIAIDFCGPLMSYTGFKEKQLDEQANEFGKGMPQWAPYYLQRGAKSVLKQFKKDGHELLVVTSAKSYRQVRDWLNKHDLQWIGLQTGIGHKAGWLRDNGFDLLIEDTPSYLKAADTCGLFTFQWTTPDNDWLDWAERGTKRFQVEGWDGVEMFVNKIVAGTDSYSKRIASEDEAEATKANRLKEIRSQLVALRDELAEILED